MIEIALLEKIIIALVNIFGFFLSFWVIGANKKNRLNQWFFIMTFFVIFWVDFAVLGNIVSNQKLSVMFYRLNWTMVGFFLIASFYFYVVNFLKIKSIFLRKVILIVGFLLSGLCLFSPFIIKNINSKPWGNEIVFGSLNIFFNLYALFVALLVIGFLIKKYSAFGKIDKLKTQYLLIGTFLFALANIIFNVIVPSLTTTVAYQHYGDYSAILLLGFSALAIVKQNLFGIKVVLTQIFVVLIALLLLVDFLTSETNFEYVWKGAILVSFISFGWLLIKSVLQEIKQKEQLNQYATDMAKANTDLQDAYGKLELLDKAKSEFISIASHQLRTPLTAIKGYISMMIEGDYGKISKEAMQSMKNVYSANERLVKLVNSLLDMSRIEAGKITLEFLPVKVDDLVADVLRELRVEAANKKLKLKIVKDKTVLPKIQADGAKLRDALMNLVDNAIKYTNKGGITVSIKATGDKMEIVVQDSGEGMEKEEIDKLFQSFSRADSGRKNWAEGSGLGLYIAKKFIEMHHGTIHAESQGKGLGSRFVIELPISQPSTRG